ncbi:uncharacterized protein K441DRAFT_660060 [Cenococcum geophilum 1.58]|uniref:uncharacterized protein n=1 Tax=Cenococcum geophilum 1.58 TaxID=794803 RepID=UPI00358F4CAF|nr:hypothetical protein K441DRAFT_660060 [Cenococcum geophilum 1.58]
MGYDLVSVSVSVFEFAQIVLQVYRDKNLRNNLDLRNPRAFRVYALISISAPRAFRVYALTSISVTPEPFKSTP